MARSWEAAPGRTPRLSLVHEPQRGAATAKNRGAAQARGDVLVFLDADSTLGPAVAQDVADAWRSGARGGSIPVQAESDDFWERGFFTAMELGKRVFGIHCQMFYLDRRLFHQLGGFRHELRLAEDLELMRRAAASLGTGNGRLQRMGGSGFQGQNLDGSCIRTSPRRMRAMPWRFGMIWMLARWTLGFVGIGRRWYVAGGPAPGAGSLTTRWVRRLARAWLRLVLFSAGSHPPARPAVSRRIWGAIKGIRADLEALARQAEAGAVAHNGDPVKALAATGLLFRGAGGWVSRSRRDRRTGGWSCSGCTCWA